MPDLPPWFKAKHVPLNVGFSRATNFEIRFDGGSFQLIVMEFRESGDERAGAEVESWQMVEIGRYALSPMALGRLAAAAEHGFATYRQAIGDLPNPEKVGSVLKKLADESKSRRR